MNNFASNVRAYDQEDFLRQKVLFFDRILHTFSRRAVMSSRILQYKIIMGTVLNLISNLIPCCTEFHWPILCTRLDLFFNM